ncbi:MAG TPA: hypothetical protein VK915_12985 [Gaiellaceae bacterium]|nr:hypothetical protein [Gaiellaceae bacterium]
MLWRDDRKILSRWPTVSRFPLERAWRFGGEARRLVRGEAYVLVRLAALRPRLRGRPRDEQIQFEPEGAAE